MPQLKALTAGGPSGRQLLEETLEELASEGYARTGTVEGGQWSAVISSGRTGGLFDEKRITVVEGAELLGPFPDTLLPFLEEDGASEVILLVYDGTPGKVFSPEAGKKIVFLKAEKTSLAPWERKGWITDRARRMEISISDDAASILAEMIDDPAELRSELEKLGAYAAGEQVDEETVSPSMRERNACLSRRLLQGESSEVFSSLERLKRKNPCSPCSLPSTTGYARRCISAFFPGKEGEWGQACPPDQGISSQDVPRGSQALPERRSFRSCRGAAGPFLEGKHPQRKAGSGFEALLVRCMDSAGKK